MNAFARILRNLPNLIVAVLAVLLLAAIAMAHRYSPPHLSHIADLLMHTLHGPGFAAVAVLAFASLQVYRPGPKNYLYAAAVTIAIGVFAEAAQIPGPRDAEFSDLLVDATGAIGALGLIALFDGGMRRRLGDRAFAGVVLVGAASLTSALGPTAWLSYVWVSQHRAAPVLLDFESHWERAVFSQSPGHRPDVVPAPAGWPIDGHVAHVRESARYGTLIRLTPYPDWSGYGSLSFIAASGDGSTEEVLVSVRDVRRQGERHNNRFDRTIEVGPEPKRFRISLDDVRATAGDRPFDLVHVESLTLDADRPHRPISLYFDDFRLEPARS